MKKNFLNAVGGSLHGVVSNAVDCDIVAPVVAVPPWATETVLSPWLVADEARVLHVLSHVVWWKKKCSNAVGGSLHGVVSNALDCDIVAPGVAVPPWATETVLSPWLAADEARVSHVLSHVVWWKKKLFKCSWR